MKYHKIKNVPLSICTAEQKIAYNIAFRADINLGDRFRSFVGTNCAKMDAIHELIKNEIHLFRCAYDYKPGKYDEDAIFCCLNAGLRGYLDYPFIASDYESIGKAFPAEYL